MEPTQTQHQQLTWAHRPLGELARITSRRRREMGQQVAIIDPFRDSGIPESELGRKLINGIHRTVQL